MTYTIIAGVNGVGKSSFIGAKKKDHPEFGRIVDDDVPEMINSFIENKMDFAQETTLSGKTIIRNVMKARQAGYTVKMYYIAVSSAEESITRIENRVRKGGHDIPDRDVVRRFENRIDDIRKISALLDSAEFYDNENGYRLVGMMNGGEIIVFDDAPGWMTMIIKAADVSRL